MDEPKKTGLQAVIDMFRVMDEASALPLLERLAKESPELVAQIRESMLIFADLCEQENTVIQQLIREIPRETLLLALRGIPETQVARFLANMSQRARQSFQEEQKELGPVRLTDTEAARQSVISLARQLESEGKLNLQRGTPRK